MNGLPDSTWISLMYLGYNCSPGGGFRQALRNNKALEAAARDGYIGTVTDIAASLETQSFIKQRLVNSALDDAQRGAINMIAFRNLNRGMKPEAAADAALAEGKTRWPTLAPMFP